MNAFVHLCRWEVRRLMRTGTARATLGLLFVAGLLALGAADREIDRQAREIASLDAHYASALAVVAEHHAPRAHAGEIAYYTFFPTHHAAPALAKLSLGLRDLVPAAVWVRLLGLEGQLYTSAIGNPAVQALGPFDDEVGHGRGLGATNGAGVHHGREPLGVDASGVGPQGLT